MFRIWGEAEGDGEYRDYRLNLRSSLIVRVSLPLVIFEGPFVRRVIGALVAAESRLGVDALELPVPPERSLHRVDLTAYRTAMLLLMLLMLLMLLKLLIGALAKRLLLLPVVR
jgi:hypothetical protein